MWCIFKKNPQTYIYSFSEFFPYQNILSSSVASHPTDHSVHMPVPTPSPLSSQPVAFGNHKIVFTVCDFGILIINAGTLKNLIS